MGNRTHGSNNLRLQAKLVLETACKVADAAFSIGRDIGNFANVVEHVSASEEQHSDETEGSPQVAVLQDGDDVGRCNSDEGNSTEDSGRDGDDLDPVDGAGDGRFGSVGGELASDPGLDLLSRLGTGRCQITSWVFREGRITRW